MKDHNLEHCRRKNPGLLERKKRQALYDCGETLINICIKAPPDPSARSENTTEERRTLLAESLLTEASTMRVSL